MNPPWRSTLSLTGVLATWVFRGGMDVPETSATAFRETCHSLRGVLCVADSFDQHVGGGVGAAQARPGSAMRMAESEFE